MPTPILPLDGQVFTPIIQEYCPSFTPLYGAAGKPLSTSSSRGYPCFLLTPEHAELLKNSLGKEVRLSSLGYSQQWDNGTKAEAYSGGEISRDIILEELWGYAPYLVSHLGRKVQQRNVSSALLPLEFHDYQEGIDYPGGVEETVMLQGISCQQGYVGLIGRIIYLSEQEISRYLPLPEQERQQFFHALGHCGSTQRKLSSRAKPISPKAEFCPLRLGKNDAAGILRRYLQRIIP